MERCTARGVIHCPQPASVRGGNRAANRQAEAETILFGGEERIEDSIQPLLRDTVPMIPDRDLDPPFRGETRANGDQPLMCRCPNHRIAGIAHQVYQHLL